MIDLAASLASVPRQYAEGAVKITEDLLRYEAVILRVQPDVIVEAGAFSGKSSLWFCRTAGCRVVTIDVTPCIDPETAAAWTDLPIRLLVGSTTDPATIAAVQQTVDETTATLGRAARVMVSLDSDHSAAHVAAEIAAYAPLVTPGSYMVVEDGLLRWMSDEERRHYTGTPLDAIETFLASPTGAGWVNDQELEDAYPATQHPSGWLRRP